MGIHFEAPINLYHDNDAAKAIMSAGKMPSRTKHMAIITTFNQAHHNNETVHTVTEPTTMMLADFGTKPVTAPLRYYPPSLQTPPPPLVRKEISHHYHRKKGFLLLEVSFLSNYPILFSKLLTHNFHINPFTTYSITLLLRIIETKKDIKLQLKKDFNYVHVLP